MSRINVNDRVKVVAGFGWVRMFNGWVGVVQRMHELRADTVAIVEFEDGTTAKISVDDLVKVEYKSRETEDPNTIPEGAKRITADDFGDAVAKSTASFAVNVGDITKGMSGLLVGADIGRKLFESRDSVVMTKDEVIATLWDGCSPANVCDSVDGETSLDKSFVISINAIESLREVADILFGESKNA